MANKVEPRILSGFLELLPEDQIIFDRMKETIEKTYKKYGFVSVETPIIEYSEVLLAKAGGETEKQIYRFNKGDNDLSLRFDHTVPLARYVAKNYPYLIFPFKRYSIGKVFRGERPQKGRYREFYQCDIDVVGNEVLDLNYDSELPLIIYDTFTNLGFKNITINLNNRKILTGLFNELGLTELKDDVLRLIDKLDKIGYDNFTASLKDIINDEKIISKLIEFLNIKGSCKEIISSLKELNYNDETFNLGVNELETVINNMNTLGLSENNYSINLRIARGLDYYTGTIYETFLDDYKELGSVCSGGRYNDLATYYTDKTLPGVGISIGLTRLYSKLKEINFYSNERKSSSKVMVINLDGGFEEALSLTTKLRNENINVDMPHLLNKGMKQKMQYASRLAIPYVVIIGEDEVKNHVYALKDMAKGEQVLLSYEELLKRLK